MGNNNQPQVDKEKERVNNKDFFTPYLFSIPSPEGFYWDWLRRTLVKRK